MTAAATLFGPMALLLAIGCILLFMYLIMLFIDEEDDESGRDDP
jgi:hypothetical protein